MTSSIASKIFVNLITNRGLNCNEIKDFSDIHFIELKEYVVAGNQLIEVEGNLVDYFNSWTLSNNYERTCSLNLTIKSGEEEHFFVESLMWLIENFFIPRGITLNGFFSGYDEIFGFHFRYNVVDNQVFFDFERLHYVQENHKDESLDEIFSRLIL